MDRSEAAKTAQAAPDSRSGKLTGTGPANAAAGSEAAPEEVPGANSNASAGLLGGEEKTPAFAGGGKRIAAVPEKRNSGIEKSGPKGPAGDAATLPATGTEISAAIPEASPEKQILSSELPVPRKDPAAREKVTAPVPFVFAADRQAQRECPAAGPAPEGLDRSVSGHSARPETAAQSSAGKVSAMEGGRIRTAARTAPHGKVSFPGVSRSEGAGRFAENLKTVSETRNQTAAPETAATVVAHADGPEDSTVPADFENAARIDKGLEKTRSNKPVPITGIPQGAEMTSQTADRMIERVAAGGISSQEVSALARKQSGEGDRRPAEAAGSGRPYDTAAAARVSSAKNPATVVEPAVPESGRGAAAGGDSWTAFAETIGNSVRKAENAGLETQRRTADVSGMPMSSAENGAVAAGEGRSAGSLSAFVAPSGLDQAPRVEIQATMVRIAEEGRRLVVDEGGGQVRMSLEPPELGSLDMDVKVRNSSVQIVLTAEDRNVQQLLQSQRDVLERALAEGGLRVESFDVVLSSSADGGNPSFQRGQAHQGAPAAGTAQDGVAEPEAESAASARIIRDEALGNGISLFV